MAEWEFGTLGFVGLGHMGHPMVTHLLKSAVPTLVYDLDQDKTSDLAKHGARVAQSVAEITANCQILALSLPDPPAVEKVAGQILGAAREGVTVVDLTTSDPKLSQALHERMKHAEMHFIDAPVSGGPVRSADGTLTIMVGGDDAAVAAARPLLDLLGKHIVHVGGPGMGNVAKLVNNMVTLSNILTASEALLLAARAGIPAQRMAEIMTTGTASSYALARISPKILSGEYDPGMTLTLALKDIGLAAKLGHDVGAPLQVGAVTERIIKAAIDAGYSEKDVSFMHEALKLKR